MNYSYDLILGDCLKALMLLDVGAVDLIVTSPPLWKPPDKNIFDESYRSYLCFLEERFREIFRVLKHDGKFCK